MSFLTLHSVISQFIGPQSNLNVTRFGNGLINKSYLIGKPEGQKRFLLQQINTHVFKNPAVISSNIKAVQAHLYNGKIDYPFLKFLSPNSKDLFFVDESGGCWRMYEFVENCFTLEAISDENGAGETAFQFARFTAALQSMNPVLIKPAIPDFHNLKLRYQQFELSIKHADPFNLKSAEPLVTFLRNKNHYVDIYLSIINDKDMPVRIIHADAKISNILFKQSDSKPYCVIDFDTLMPGYFFSDLGDMIRTMVCSHDENESDCEKIVFRKSFYDAIVHGYCSAIQLTQKEKCFLNYAGVLMTYMQALRFLTDHLNGNLYYAVSYKEHNLDRTKNQCKLLELIEKNLSIN